MKEGNKKLLSPKGAIDCSEHKSSARCIGQVMKFLTVS
jgi:hypothetical protein